MRLFSALLASIAVLACDRPPEAAEAPLADMSATGELTRATAGDTVWAVFYFVQADKRGQFESFLHETLRPLGARVGQADPAIARAHAQVRVLHPVSANEDGSYTYGFIMDPVVGGVDYTIRNLLILDMGEEEGRRVYREQFLDALTERPFELHQMVQAR